MYKEKENFREAFMAKSRKDGYLYGIFFRGYLFYALIAAALFAGALFVSKEFGADVALKNTEALLITFSAVAGYFFLIAVLSSVASYNKNRIDLYDSFYMSAFFIGAFYAIYNLATNGFTSADLWRYIVSAVLVIAGLVYVICHWATYGKGAEKAVSETIPCKVVRYYDSVVKNGKFAPILLLSAVITVCWYLFLFKKNLAFTDAGSVIVTGICLVPAFLHLIFGTGGKKTGVFDGILLADAIALPAIFFTVGAFTDTEVNITRMYLVALCILGFVIFFSIMRLVNFDDNSLPVKKEAKNAFSHYIGLLKEKSEPLCALACGGVLAVLLLVFFRYSELPALYNLLKEGKITGLNCILLFSVTLLGYGSLVMSGVLAFINLKAKDITAADFFLLYILSFSLFGIVTFAKYPSGLGLVILPLSLLLSLTLFVSRTRFLFEEKAKN